MRTHFHNSRQNVHLEYLNRVKFNLKKMFTPPKEKDVWTAMTKGSTGGWAKPFAKPATLLPAAAALAAIPFSGGVSAGFLPAILGGAGGLIGGIQGATTGLWGKPGVGSALKGGGIGALQGVGVGGLGEMFGAGGASSIPTSAGGYISNPYPGAVTGSQLATSGGYGLTGSGLATSGAGATAGSAYGASLASKVAGSGITNAFNATAGTGTGVDALTKPWYSKALEGINPYQTAIGAALSAYPTLTGEKTAQIPQSELYGAATSRLLGDEGFSALGKLGREQLTNQLSGQFEPVPDEYYNASKRRMDEAYDKAEKDFAASYKGLRPGANVENDSAFQTGVNKIRQDRARETSALAADLDYRREMDYYDRKMTAINSSLNLDQQTMADYISLAQMDTERLAINTGISIGDAQKFKEIFGDLGGMFLKKGLNLENPDTVIQRMKGTVG
jgi:hypothetical protein